MVRQRAVPASAVDVVVVGAGAAGIAAASELIKHGFNVTVLEAGDRIGGRIWSMPFGEGSVDLGAQAIWGREHDLYELAERENLLQTTEDHCQTIIDLFEEDSKVTSSCSTLVNQIRAEIHSLPAQLRDSDRSFGDALSGVFTEYHKASTHTDVVQAVYDNFKLLWRTMTSADSLDSISQRSLTDRRLCDPRPVRLTVPFIELLERLAANLPEETVKLNQTVTRIEFNDSKWQAHRVKVRTAGGRVYAAHHVIMTVSLGVLKHHIKTLFSPQLPAIKVQAVEAAGFGTMEKVVLVYEKPFWEEFTAGPSAGLLQLLRSSKVDPNSPEGALDWTDAVNEIKIFTHPMPPNSLGLFVAGKEAEQIAGLTDEQLMQDATRLIKRFTGRQTPQPLAVLRGNWSSNPLFRGSLSYISHDFIEKGFEIGDLAEPVWPYKSSSAKFEVSGLLFAGEATHSSCFSRVNGAWASGRREAERIRAFYAPVGTIFRVDKVDVPSSLQVQWARDIRRHSCVA